jgi:hypothetical protein
MSKTIILRFRDLITEDEGTIYDHMNLITDFGEVWWGWWMKQYEIPPRELFIELISFIENNNFLKAYLFNTGSNKIYETNIKKILVAPLNHTIQTPDPVKSPNYYHRGSYPAWFLLINIREVNINDLNLKLIDVPSLRNKDKKEYQHKLNKNISDLSDLQKMNVTMWLVESK